jgi:hypothetical protein
MVRPNLFLLITNAPLIWIKPVCKVFFGNDMEMVEVLDVQGSIPTPATTAKLIEVRNASAVPFGENLPWPKSESGQTVSK